MRATYLLRDGVLVDKATGKPAPTRPDFVPSPRITRDIAPYMSMASRKMVDGRAAQREDLARSGCRLVDPSEYKPTYESKERAIANKGEWEPRKKVDLGDGYMRLNQPPNR